MLDVKRMRCKHIAASVLGLLILCACSSSLAAPHGSILVSGLSGEVSYGDVVTGTEMYIGGLRVGNSSPTPVQVVGVTAVDARGSIRVLDTFLLERPCGDGANDRAVGQFQEISHLALKAPASTVFKGTAHCSPDDIFRYQVFFKVVLDKPVMGGIFAIDISYLLAGRTVHQRFDAGGILCPRGVDTQSCMKQVVDSSKVTTA